MLPDGKRFLFLATLGQPETRGVYLANVDGGEPTRLLPDHTAAVFAPPNRLLLMRQGALVALGFDPASGSISGEPVPVAQGVGEFLINRGSFSVSDTGVLAYRGGSAQRRQLVWVDRAGKMQGTIGSPDENALASPELSPDGRRVLAQRIVQGNVDIWLIDVARGVPSRFTFDAREDTFPLWSPDGRRVVFSSSRSDQNLFEKPASGAGEEQPLHATGTPLSWSPDGRHLLYQSQQDLWALPLVGERKPFPIAQTPFQEVSGQFSPDGRWVAYVSNESGRMEVYVRPFPGPGGASQVSTTGGSHPRWRPNGKELFYVAPDTRLMAVPIASAPDRQTLEPGAPVPLFATRFAIGASISVAKPQYAVAADGRFLMNVDASEATPAPITVVLNWDAAFRK